MEGVTNSFIILLLTILGLQAAIWNEDPRNFKSGEIYQYKYTSQVLSGLPKTSAEFNGLQINSLIEFNINSNNKIFMILKNTEVLESVKNIKTRNPYKFFEGKYFKKVGKTKSKSLKKLSLPIAYRWRLAEKISKFVVLPDDETLSINIKRGILNMINMKLIFSDNDWKEEGGSYHIPKDEGIEGICEANYVWTSFPYVTPANKKNNFRSLVFSRTKSANKCQNPAGYDFANFLVMETEKDKTDQNRTLVKNVNFASLNITISKSKNFFIWEASTKSSYSIEPNDISKETMSTFVVQSLKYLDTKPLTNPVSDKGMKKKSLIMNISKIAKTLTKADTARIVTLIRRLGNLTDSVNLELLQLLREANDQDFKLITKNVQTIVATEPELIKSYLYVLSEVLTYSSSKSLIHDFILKPSAIINDDNQMALRLGAMAGLNTVKDSKLIDLLTSSSSKFAMLKNKNRSNTLKSAWLTIGSLVGTHFSQNRKYDIKSTIKWFTKVLMSLKTSLGDEIKNITILKALGNIGTIEIFPYLYEVLNNKLNPISLRVQAIYSLRKIPRNNKTIELILIRIYNDINEDVELRLAAALDILLRHKCKLTVKGLVSRLSQEPILQVKAFVQDLIFTLSKMPKLRDIYKPLLLKINVRDYSNEYSKIFSIPTRNGYIHFSMIYSPDSLIPRTGNILYIESIFGKLIMPLEIGFRFENGKNSKILPYKNLKEYIINIMKMSQLERDENAPTMALFIKRFDNEIAYFSMDSELVKLFNVKSFSDIIEFFNGNKILNTNLNLKRMINAEIYLPTIMGFKYSAKVYSNIDFRLNIDLSKTLDMLKNSNKLNIGIKRQTLMETVFNYGIDAGYIKSEVNSKLLFVTPREAEIIISVEKSTFDFTIGINKPKKNFHLFKHLYEKKFKVTYYNAVTDLTGISKYYKITPFYLSEKEARKINVKTLPFPFGMNMTWSYFCDAVKPRNDDIQKSWFSAGDTYSDVWIKLNGTSYFDGFQIGFKQEIFHGTKKFIVNVNHLKNKIIVNSFVFASFRLAFSLSNRIEISWPQTIEDIKEMIQFDSILSPLPKIKYVDATGTFNVPKIIQFNQSNPFQVLRNNNPYNLNLKAYIRDSTRDRLYTMKLNLGIDKEKMDLVDKIAKNPKKYSEDNEVLSICNQDLGRGIPNSPACFQSWLTLNDFNMIRLSLNWTHNGSLRFKNIYNRINRKVLFSKYLTIAKFADIGSDYEFAYFIPPYFHRSNRVSISYLTFTNFYKYIKYPRSNIGQRIFNKICNKPSLSSESKVCQIRGVKKTAAIKTFDNYFYNIDRFIYKDAINDVRTIILMQDENNIVQIIGARTSKEIMVQILLKEFPPFRIIKTGNNINFYVNSLKQSQPYMSKNEVVATFSRLTNTVYGNKTLYEINLKTVNIRVVTDLDEMLDIEVSKNFWSTLRGVCGDMNGELYNEFKNLDCTAVYSSPESIFESEYKRNFKDINTDENIKKFVTMKRCLKSTKFSLI